MAIQDARLYLRVAESLKDAMDRAAEAAGLSLSEWVRDRLRRAADRERPKRSA